MKRSEHRILTTHVGSLVRPETLVDAIKAGKGDGYEKVLAEATRDIVRQQAEVGIDIVSDGEFGKGSWAQYLLDRVTGFEHRPDQLRQVEWLGRDRERYADFLMDTFPGAAKGRPTDACVGEVKYKSLDAIDAVIANFKGALNGTRVEEAFLTAVAPASSAYDGINEYYKDEREYVYALADALRQEYQAIYKSGLLLQVDDAVLANMYDTLVQKDPANYRRWAELRIEALNHALEGIPEDRVRYHICFGSWHVPHTADANLSDIIDLILKVKAGAYAIESANPRHEHEWRVWQDVAVNRKGLPNGRILIPGVVTHHTVTVEHPRLVADRIVRFAKILGRENVIAGTDCGFAQIETIARVHPTIMWAKLESLVEGARIASKELWN
jgi:5-methyltetrahydropteroyltriglutamate--homocysteine methyltransferase